MTTSAGSSSCDLAIISAGETSQAAAYLARALFDLEAGATLAERTGRPAEVLRGRPDGDR